MLQRDRDEHNRAEQTHVIVKMDARRGSGRKQLLPSASGVLSLDRLVEARRHKIKTSICPEVLCVNAR
jgi:hypothetical protein